MRLILAGLFVFAGIMIAVTLLSGVISRVPPILLGSGMGLFVIFLIVFALVIFNGPFATLGTFVSQEEHIRRLEEKGLLVSNDFHAVRVFEIKEFEDEGPHYFLQLAGGSVLYLNGQYLYDYDTSEDEDEDIPPKSFPCMDFTVKRHSQEGYVVDMICRGTLLEPEAIGDAFSRDIYRRGQVPQDGDIITGKSFEELKALLVPQSL